MGSLKNKLFVCISPADKLLQIPVHYEYELTETHNCIEYFYEEFSCVKEMSRRLKCSCGYLQDIAVQPEGHKTEYLGAVTKPTCTSAGEYIYVCTVCKDFQYVAVPPAHSIYYMYISSATCTQNAVKKAYCSKCDYSEEPIEVENTSLNHSLTMTFPEIEPSCTSCGYTEGIYCYYCKEFISGREEIPPHNHKNRTEYEGIAPGCTSSGLSSTIICNDCNCILQYSGSIPELGHDEISHAAKAATCTQKGNNAYVTCSRVITAPILKYPPPVTIGENI